MPILLTFGRDWSSSISFSFFLAYYCWLIFYEYFPINPTGSSPVYVVVYWTVYETVYVGMEIGFCTWLTLPKTLEIAFW